MLSAATFTAPAAAVETSGVRTFPLPRRLKELIKLSGSFCCTKYPNKPPPASTHPLETRDAIQFQLAHRGRCNLMQAVAKHLHAVISGCFPYHARIDQVVDKGDFTLRISWPSPRDSDRPATTIELTIAREAIDAYSSASVARQQLADVRLANSIREKLAQFSHDPDGERVVANWLVGGLTLN